MRGDKNDVLDILVCCHGSVEARAVAEMIQNRAYAEDCLGFWNRVWGSVTGKSDEELPAFPPLRRVKRSLRALERKGRASSALRQSHVDRAWRDHYSPTEEGRAHYRRRYPHVKPAQA